VHAPTGRVGGWNLRCVQNTLDEPWLDAPAGTEARGAAGWPHRAAAYLAGLRGSGAAHGRFEVVSARPGEKVPCAPGALILDYGAGGHPPLDVTVLLRDVAVCVRPGDPTLLIGRAFIDVGRAITSAPAVFLLERSQPLRDASPIEARSWFAAP
jgi:hypothetical protein